MRTHTIEDVEQSMARLRVYWQKGQDSLKQNPDRVPYGSSSEKLRKSRVFASRYNEVQLDRLIEKCVRQQRVLGISFVDRLATVINKKDRATLETKVLTNGWSLSRLNREIRSQFGTRKQVGRKPQSPVSVNDTLSDIIRWSMKTVRWGEMMGWNANTGEIEATDDESSISLTELPDEIAKAVEETLVVTQNLYQLAQQTLDQERGQD